MSREDSVRLHPGPLAGIDRFPRVRLCHAPTPLDPAPNLGAALGIELWIKRDDCTGLAMGGNKLRQLEFHLGEARSRGADTLLVTGAVQSNLARLAAAGARRLKMDVHIQQEERVSGAGSLHRTSGNVLLDRLMGATLHSYPRGNDEAGADANMERLARKISAEGRTPYVIHSSADRPPLGGLGYVVAAKEIAEQAAAIGVAFDAVVCASGSGLTHAGILVGLRELGQSVSVYGICVRRDAERQRARVARITEDLTSMIGSGAPVHSGEINVCDAVHSQGYGRLNENVSEAIALGARHDALLLDPVYTGKAMAGLVGHLAAGRIRAGSRVLFLHTGGTPALFAYGDQLAPQ